VADVGGTVTQAEVTSIAAGTGGGFTARAGDRVIDTRTVLLACGVADRAPILPGLEQVIRRGLLRQCPICDGHEHRGKRIAVLGDGRHAQRESVFISHFSPRVSLIPMSKGLAAAATHEQEDTDEEFAEAVDDGRVSRLDSPAVGATLQPDGSVRVLLHDGRACSFDVLYAALGCRPKSHLARELGVKLDDAGQLLVDGGCSTNVPGVYAAGDVVDALDQLAVAIGHGAIAATAIHNRCRRASRGATT
jgi:thioredoxin reductase (NADPH)